eukprot:2519540-Rhodomonas_salina.1
MEPVLVLDGAVLMSFGLRVCDAMSGIEIAYDGTVPYAYAMRCPVLRSRMVLLPVRGGEDPSPPAARTKHRARRSQIKKPTCCVRSVPGARIIVFDFAVSVSPYAHALRDLGHMSDPISGTKPGCVATRFRWLCTSKRSTGALHSRAKSNAICPQMTPPPFLWTTCCFWKVRGR